MTEVLKTIWDYLTRNLMQVWTDVIGFMCCHTLTVV